MDVHQAKKLARAGQQLMSEYSVTRDQLEGKCQELRSVCKKTELLFTRRRQALLKFLDLFEEVECVTKVGDTRYTAQDANNSFGSGVKLLSNILTSPRRSTRRVARTSSTTSASWTISLRRNVKLFREKSTVINIWSRWT